VRELKVRDLRCDHEGKTLRVKDEDEDDDQAAVRHTNKDNDTTTERDTFPVIGL
jgi:hypothetical protein